MTHYDKFYDGVDEEQLAERRATLQDRLHEHVDEMNLPSLELLYHISKNMNLYKSFFTVMQMDRYER